MKYDIIFAGVGGQGVVSASSMFVAQADRLGYKCKQNEVHGMAQRGGAVVCFIRISDEEIYSDIIPRGGCDIILGMEPMEAMRYVDYLSPDGCVVTSNRPIKNIEYPDEQKLIGELKGLASTVVVDSNALVDELKNERIINVAMLGALTKKLGIDGLKEAILGDVKKRFAKKGEAIVELNYKAFEFGENA